MAAFHAKLFGLILLLSGSAAWAQAPVSLAVKDPKPSIIDFGYCRDAGQVESWEANVGDTVKEGQLILKLDHARQLHAYEAAKLKAESDAPMESVLGELKQKEAAMAESHTRYRRRQISQQQLRMSEGEVDAIRGKLTQVQLNKKLSKLDLELAEKLLEMRYIRSPIAGTIMKIAQRPGERCAVGDIVVTVSDTANIVTEMPLSGQILNHLQEGASIPLRVAGSRTTQLAKVLSISPLAGATNGEKMVKVAFANAEPGLPIDSQQYELLMPEGTKLAPITTAAPAAAPSAPQG